MRTVRSRSRRGERGQAAVEWVLTLPIVVVLIAVLYQALMFERDVFNKMNVARYEAFKQAHEGQNEEGMKEYEILEIKTQGSKIGELTSFTIPAQTVDPEKRYGPKTYYFPCGTKRFFPGGDTGETVLDVLETVAVVIDHFEWSAKASEAWGNGMGAIGDVAGAIPCEEASEGLNSLGSDFGGGDMSDWSDWLGDIGL